MLYEVKYEIMTEDRTNSFLGSTRSDLQNLITNVEAKSPNQACAMVEAMNGGHSHCRAIYAFSK
jgi:hypothetical protein